MSASSETSIPRPAATNRGRKSSKTGRIVDIVQRQSPTFQNSSTQPAGDASEVSKAIQDLHGMPKIKNADPQKNMERLVQNAKLLLALLCTKQQESSVKEKSVMGKVITAYLCWGLHTGWCKATLGLPEVYKKNVVRQATLVLNLLRALRDFSVDSCMQRATMILYCFLHVLGSSRFAEYLPAATAAGGTQSLPHQHGRNRCILGYFGDFIGEQIWSKFQLSLHPRRQDRLLPTLSALGT